MKSNYLKSIVFMIIVGITTSCNFNNQTSENDLTENRLNDKSEIIELINTKIKILNNSELDPDSLIAPPDELPWTYPPKVKLKKISSDTLYIQILNEFYLTQSMGTTGAEYYIDSVANEFFEIEELNYINFSFSPGDHAEPGVYSRTGYELRNE